MSAILKLLRHKPCLEPLEEQRPTLATSCPFVNRLTLAAIVLGSCFTPQIANAALIYAVNHTHWAINHFAVDGRSGVDIIGPYQSGGGGCCYMAPARWVPGMTVRVDWETGSGGSKGFPGFADEDRYEAWAAPRRAMKRSHSKLAAVPDYTGQKTCGINVHFLPCDEVQVSTSCHAYGTPEYPIKTPLHLPEPQSCPK